MAHYILGISAFYHDSAAALLRDGEIVSAAQEERFSRRKGDQRFPQKSIDFCLSEAGITNADLSAVAYYDKPVQTFSRLLQTYLEFPHLCWPSFKASLPLWINEKLQIPKIIDRHLTGFTGEIFFSRHHESHAASTFFCSPFEEAAILIADGIGEWACTSIGEGTGNQLKLIKEVRFPHSLGLLYTSITQYLGFKVNSDEYKVMGLAPYGVPRYVDLMREQLIEIKEDGSIFLNLSYFSFAYGLKMINKRMEQFFGQTERSPDSRVEQFHMDVAASLQEITTEVQLRLARYVRRVTGKRYLCMAGGVALNCVANGAIYREGVFDNIYIQPAAGDAGGALGAALQVWYQVLGKPRQCYSDRMVGSYLGPAIEEKQAKSYFESVNCKYQEIANEELAVKIGQWISQGYVIGLCQGRMEFGPRSLGARSILADPRDANTQTRVNLKVKYRESFRPFAPAVLEDEVKTYFDIDIPSPYMLLVMPVKHSEQKGYEENLSKSGIDKLKVQRSNVPAITHVDYSVRLQTVTRERNGIFYDIISEFKKITGCPMIVNTSFNVRGEPIVCDHEDAYRCFLMTDIDILVVNNLVVTKPAIKVFC